MNKLLAILFGFGAAFTAMAQSDSAPIKAAYPAPHLDSLWYTANRQYAEGSYSAAAANYAVLMDTFGIANPDLYYNAANVFFKQNEIAKAILYYEKALKLAPNNDDILYNLLIAEQQTIDKIEAVPVFFVIRWLGAIPQWFGADVWGVLSLLTFALMFVCLLLINVGKRKRTLLIAAGGLLAVSLVTLRIAVEAKNNAEQQTYAIVMLPVTTVKSSPDNSSIDLFILHEGAKLQMMETIGSWVKIKIADGNQGWIPKNSIQAI